MHPSKTAAWWYAIRPWSLLMTIAPVLTGTTLAWAEQGTFELSVALTVALAAVLIHIGCNLQNDAGGFARGADRFDRPGPPRATTLGWLAAHTVRRGATGSLVLAGVFGLWLVARGGWPILLLGCSAIAAATLYMAGPRPLAYGAASEALVVVFFGLVPVSGSYYLQAQAVSASALQAGTVLGLLGAAVLALNNYRDMRADRCSGRRTLAVVFGERFCRAEFVTLLALTGSVVIAMILATNTLFALTLLMFPASLELIRKVRRSRPGTAINALLRDAVRLNFTTGMLLSASAALMRALG